jgi:PAS domain S-box-containing protein
MHEPRTKVVRRRANATVVSATAKAVRPLRPRPWLPWLSLAVAMGTFLLDINGAPAPVPEILYIFPPLLCLWSHSHRQPLLVAANVTALSIVAVLLRGDLGTAVVVERAASLAAVWLTVGSSLLRAHDQKAIITERAIGRSYLDISEALITVLDTDERIVLMNAKGCEILGVEPGDLLGDNGVDRLFPVEVRDEVRRSLGEMIAGRAPAPRLESLLVGREGVRTIDWHWAAPRDDQGAVMYLVGSGTDLTDRRRAEASLLGQAALTRLGEMALMVAHEVKNPLAGIRGAVQVMGDRLSADPQMTPAVERVLRSIDGLTELVDDLLVFARPGRPTRASVHVLSLLRDVALLLAKDPRFDHAGVVVAGEDVQVQGDARLLRQAFLNLLLNAAEAAGPRGRIDVQVRSAGAGCVVEIHDTGPGIPPEMRTRIFEPFYSTKGRGSGLGLAIALRVAILHGGDIGVDCPTQGGTTMSVTLAA